MRSDILKDEVEGRKRRQERESEYLKQTENICKHLYFLIKASPVRLKLQ